MGLVVKRTLGHLFWLGIVATLGGKFVAPAHAAPLSDHFPLVPPDACLAGLGTLSRAPSRVPQPLSLSNDETPPGEATPPPPNREPAPREPSDTDFDNLPPSDQASGVQAGAIGASEQWRWGPRVLLYPLRGLWWAVLAVPRAGMWAFDRYQLKERFRSVFFNDAGTFGVFPVAFFETGFGLNAGARLLWNDLFGHAEKLRVRASYGGRFRQLYAARVRSGQLLGDRAEVELFGEYQIFPRSRFFGIGADDLEDSPSDGSLIDPLTDGRAVDTRYRHDDVRFGLATIAHVSQYVDIRVTASYTSRRFDDEADADDSEQIVNTYDTSRLIGFQDGLSNIYAELELVYDSRRVNRFYLSPAAPSTGAKLSAFVGRREGFGKDPSAFFRWGIDAQRYFDLHGGDRVLVVRGYAEGVTGGIEEVSFVDLPRLGGPTLLRGYPRDRFRDRSVTLATIEYNYPAERNFGGYVFADAGRVWRDLRDFDFDGFRLGFGGGIQAHTTNGFLARFFVASSIDGGLFVNLSFDPVFDTRAREETF